jgi:uncharacterized membrane protein
MERKGSLMNMIWFGMLAVALVGCGETQSGEATQPGSAATPTFAWIQENVLQASCVRCHSAGGGAAGLDLSSYEAMMASGVIAPGSPDESELYVQIATGKMPKRAAPLSADKIEAVAEWIRQGALK